MVVRLRKRCAGVRARSWIPDIVCWFRLGSVAFSVNFHAASAYKSKMRRTCVLKTALDLAAAAVYIEWEVAGNQMLVI